MSRSRRPGPKSWRRESTDVRRVDRRRQRKRARSALKHGKHDARELGRTPGTEGWTTW